MPPRNLPCDRPGCGHLLAQHEPSHVRAMPVGDDLYQSPQPCNVKGCVCYAFHLCTGWLCCPISHAKLAERLDAGKCAMVAILREDGQTMIHACLTHQVEEGLGHHLSTHPATTPAGLAADD